MPTYRISVDVKAAKRQVDAMGARARDLTPVFAGPIDTLMTEVLDERFRAEGAAWGGTKWAALADYTLRLRKRPGHNLGGILWDTGTLRESLVTAAGQGFKSVGPMEYIRGTTVPYAKYHESTEPRTVMPRRPFFDVLLEPANDPVAVTATKIVMDYVTEGVLGT